MHNKYNDLFDTLVKSYYNGNFEETLSTKALTGEIEANFIEGMGCVGGPKAIIPKEQGKAFVDNLAYDSPRTKWLSPRPLRGINFIVLNLEIHWYH